MASPDTTQVRTTPTTAERRALQQIKTAGDRFAVIAADHGQPLVDMLDGLGLSSAPEAQRAFKADLVDTVGRDASAVLLDPDVSMPDIVDRDLVARDVGLIVRIEADGHEEHDGLRRSQLIDGLGAQGARAQGATAAKVMVFLRADREDLDGYTAQMVRAALEDCRRSDLLCVIELMTYRLDDETPEAFAARKEDLVVEGAVLLQECGSKVLKLEYPGSASGCRRVTDALDVPWAVLSAGVDHDAFCGQLRDAMDGGADGFIAGRSLWKEAVGQPRDERRRFLDGVARRRMEEMLAIVGSAAEPWASCSSASTSGPRSARRVVLDAGGRSSRTAGARCAGPRVADRRRDRSRSALRRRALAAAARGARRGARRARSRASASPAWPRPACCSTRRGAPVAPAIAWHDSRGGARPRGSAAELGASAFAARTGLPPRALCTLAKYRWLRDTRAGAARGVRWLGVGEWIVHGARRRAGAPSCRSRRAPAGSTCTRAAGGPRRSPGRRAGGAAARARRRPGRRSARSATPCRAARGAVLAVGGHDHLSAAVGAGAVGEGDVLDSLGHGARRSSARSRRSSPSGSRRRSPTRSRRLARRPGPPEPARRDALGRRAGRVLALLGVTREGRDELERAALEVDAEAGGIELRGLNDYRVELVNIGADPSPALVWRAALESAGRAARDLLDRMERVAGPHTRLVMAGGWSEGVAARAVKEAHIGPFERSDAVFMGARGAALTAGRAAEVLPAASG